MPAMSKNKCTAHSDTSSPYGGWGGASRGACKGPMRGPVRGPVGGFHRGPEGSL